MHLLDRRSECPAAIDGQQIFRQRVRTLERLWAGRVAATALSACEPSARWLLTGTGCGSTPPRDGASGGVITAKEMA